MYIPPNSEIKNQTLLLPANIGDRHNHKVKIFDYLEIEAGRIHQTIASL
jgi:hypothetical protein